ncbi:MAG: GGDEF domain-containing protein [Collinsella sp.]|nr:GGDEF domain-containing protein [Collinsella sp.]
MDTASNYTETLEKTVRDLLERQDDLIRTAFTDQLTGLGNRGGFAHSLEEIWEQELPVTMAFIDIDNLKHCNDVFGHDEGNRYILQVSLYLKLYMKVDEAAFRIGGDEFAILSTIATEDDLAERLEHCRTVLLKNNDSEMPHSFSYGVSHADPALGEVSNRMTLDADHRMYDYKLRHAMHLDRRNIAQVHTDDFEISDRVFDAFSMLNEGRYCFIENLDKHRTLWSQGACAISVFLLSM